MTRIQNKFDIQKKLNEILIVLEKYIEHFAIST